MRYHTIRKIAIFLLVMSLTLLLPNTVKAEIKFQKPDLVSVSKEDEWSQLQHGRYESGQMLHAPPCGYRPNPERLIAVVPEYTPALTVSPYPSFFVHLPKIKLNYVTESNSKLPFEFILLSEPDGDEIYAIRAKVALPLAASIIQIDLLPYIPALTLDKDYSWKFSFVCNLDDPESESSVSGKIRRVKLPIDIIWQIKRAKPLQAATIYAEKGIWVEAISSLAKLYTQSPSNLEIIANWRSLLQSVGLQDIAQHPLAKNLIFK